MTAISPSLSLLRRPSGNTPALTRFNRFSSLVYILSIGGWLFACCVLLGVNILILVYIYLILLFFFEPFFGCVSEGEKFSICIGSTSIVRYRMLFTLAFVLDSAGCFPKLSPTFSTSFLLFSSPSFPFHKIPVPDRVATWEMFLLFWGITPTSKW